jgi:hypothetical protein
MSVKDAYGYKILPFILTAYFTKLGLCDLHFVCMSVNHPY